MFNDISTCKFRHFTNNLFATNLKIKFFDATSELPIAVSFLSFSCNFRFLFYKAETLNQYWILAVLNNFYKKKKLFGSVGW